MGRDARSIVTEKIVRTRHRWSAEVAPNRVMSRRACKEPRRGRWHLGATERQGAGQAGSARGVRQVWGEGTLACTAECTGMTWAMYGCDLVWERLWLGQSTGAIRRAWA